MLTMQTLHCWRPTASSQCFNVCTICIKRTFYTAIHQYPTGERYTISEAINTAHKSTRVLTPSVRGPFRQAHLLKTGLQIE